MQTYLPAMKIVSTHGVRGEMKALLEVDDAAFLAKLKRLYTTADGAGETALLGVRPQGNVALVRLAGVDDMDAARAQVGKVWYFAKADVRLPKGRYFVDDLLGCTVKDADTGRVYGEVTAVDHPGAQDIYTITDENGAEHMMPAVPAFVKKTSVEERTIYVTPIPGIFDEPVNGDTD